MSEVMRTQLTPLPISVVADAQRGVRTALDSCGPPACSGTAVGHPTAAATATQPQPSDLHWHSSQPSMAASRWWCTAHGHPQPRDTHGTTNTTVATAEEAALLHPSPLCLQRLKLEPATSASVPISHVRPRAPPR